MLTFKSDCSTIKQNLKVNALTRTVDENIISREGLRYIHPAVTNLFYIPLNTTSEQPLIQAGDSDIVIKKRLLPYITENRVEPRIIRP